LAKIHLQLAVNGKGGQKNEGLLKLKGNTSVTFADFGQTNPHLVTLTTQEDIQIILQLVLSDQEPIKVPDAS
jgi:hypothetical protein